MVARLLVVSAASLALVVPGAPVNASSVDTAVKQAVRSYSRAYLGGQGNRAYDLLTERCQAELSRAQMNQLADAAYQIYGPLPIKSLSVTVNGDRARATYTYAVSRINQRNQPWRRVNGQWLNDNC